MYSIKKCIIVGAGISGLMAANRLKSNGVEVTLIDKGRNPGGRLSTTQIGKAIFDKGAQFITTRDRYFRSLVESWMEAGIVKPWYKGPLGNMRYVGIKGMQSVATHLARGLDIKVSHRVTYMHFDGDQWTVTARPHGEETTSHFKADFLVLTPPVPQSLALIDESNIELDYDEEEHLKRIQYTKCISVMAQLTGPAGLSLPGAMDLNLEALRWLGDNSYKGISEVEGSLTINSSPRFAQLAWDRSEEEFMPILIKALRPFIRADVESTVSHRWGYSEPSRIYKEKQPFRKNYFVDAEHRLAMCGDGFAGGRLEAAAMSGHELAIELNRAI